MRAWEVYRVGETSKRQHIDTVYYDENCDGEYVYNGLVNHDGYPADIVVKSDRQVYPKH